MKDNLNRLLELARGNDNTLEYNDILQIMKIESPDEKTSDAIENFLTINQIAVIHLEADEEDEFTEDEDHEDKTKNSSAEAYMSDDSIKMYLREIGNIPLLNAESERELAARMEQGDEYAK